MIALPQHTSARAVAYRYSQMHPSFAHESRAHPAIRRSRKLFSITILLAAALSSFGLSAKQETTPVTVEGDVSVHGAVAVLNDSLNTPYLAGFNRTIAAGQTNGELAFDIPDGKRLVIETINVSVRALQGQPIQGTFVFSNGHGIVLGEFPLQPTGLVFPGTIQEIQVAFPPIKARVDAQTGLTDEVRVVVSRGDTTGTASLTVTVMGYLVDL